MSSNRLFTFFNPIPSLSWVERVLFSGLLFVIDIVSPGLSVDIFIDIFCVHIAWTA